MTETEWLSCSDPGPMLDFLRATGKLTERKARLFAVACCRRIWQLLGEKSRRTVEVAEGFADGAVDETCLAALVSAEFDEAAREISRAGYWMSPAVAMPVRAFVTEPAGSGPGSASFDTAAQLANETLKGVPEAMTSWNLWGTVFKGERREHCEWLRDIIHPFRPPALLDASWLTPAVLSLATASYEDRILPSGELLPERLAALARALEAAGCQDAELLGHLRSPTPHVRGCHALDVVLGKA
jgi:hypothetical protein